MGPYINFGAFVYQPTIENPGFQIRNLGQGGPWSHMGLLANAPRPWPTIYGVGLALGAMPRQVIGPTAPITANQYSNPPSVSLLEIMGLSKPPFGSQMPSG